MVGQVQQVPEYQSANRLDVQNALNSLQLVDGFRPFIDALRTLLTGRLAHRPGSYEADGRDRQLLSPLAVLLSTRGKPRLWFSSDNGGSGMHFQVAYGIQSS